MEDYEQRTQARQLQEAERKKKQKEKKISDKKRKEELRLKIPEGSDNMRKVVHQHCKFLLGMTGANSTRVPDPPTAEEREMALAMVPISRQEEGLRSTGPSPSRHSVGMQGYCETQLRRLGLKRFCWDWNSGWKNEFNTLMLLIFHETLEIGLVSHQYDNLCWQNEHRGHSTVDSLMEVYFATLQTSWKTATRDPMAAEAKKKQQRLLAARKRVSTFFVEKLMTNQY